MRRPLLILCLAIIAACGARSGPTSASASAKDDPIVRMQAANVSVIWNVEDAEGKEGQIMASGVAVNPTLALTSSPALKEGVKLKGVALAVLREGKPVLIKAELAASNQKLDVIALKSAEPLRGSASFATKVPSPGDRIYTVDTQPGPNNFLSDLVHVGNVASVDRPETGARMMLIDVSSVSMSSVGCGIYDADGKLVGIVVAPLLNGQPVSTRATAVSAIDLAGFLKAGDMAYEIRAD